MPLMRSRLGSLYALIKNISMIAPIPIVPRYEYIKKNKENTSNMQFSKKRSVIEQIKHSAAINLHVKCEKYNADCKHVTVWDLLSQVCNVHH